MALSLRVVILVVAFLGAVTIHAELPEQRHPPESALRELPNRWDATWYISIASRGYVYRGTGEIRGHNVAFFPAYPLAIRAVARTLQVPRTPAAWAWVGVALSMLTFAAASVFVYRLASPYGADVAAVTVALVASYPFALFFGAAYTESFFLLGCAAAMWSLSERQWWRATAWALFTGLVRPNGLLLALPLAAIVFVDPRGEGRRSPAAWLSVAAPLVGHAIYCVFLWSLSGDPFLWVSAQRGWGRTYLGATGAAADVLTSLRDLGLVGFIALRPYDALNAIAAFFALALVVPIYRRFGLALALMVVVNLLPPIMVGGLTSLGRFTSVLFPLHLWLATATPAPWRPPLLAGMAAVQGLLAVLHYTSRPIH